MKIILSRKGFDDAYGKSANLILPDGRLVIFPIPEHMPFNGIKYEEVLVYGRSLSTYFSELNIALPDKHTGAHLDPDLDPEAYARKDNWRPIFGSHGAANSHLINNGVGTGDIFLFFGTFRHTLMDIKGNLRYKRSKPVHLLFGWLKVGERIDLKRPSLEEIPSWAHYHAHIVNDYGSSNSVYLSGLDDSSRAQAGIFEFREDRVLTRGGFNKSQWWLPHYFHPDYGTRISRHANLDRFHMRPSRVMINTVSIGQDFVVHSDHMGVIDWAMKMISD